MTDSGQAWAVAALIVFALYLLVSFGLRTALQLQVRVVAEPWLLRVHGTAFSAHVARTGVSVPGVGRLNAPARSDSEVG